MSKRDWLFFGSALAVAVVVGAGISQLASGQPDGLEFTAQQEGFREAADDQDGAPLADYGSRSGLGTALAGVAGVLLTLGVGYAVFRLARKPDRGRPAASG